MAWEISLTDECKGWYEGLKQAEQESVYPVVELLEEHGPTLPFPYSSGVSGSAYGHMRELRIQHQGEPYRILYCFDPERTAILLLGGCKTGQDRWYEVHVPKADALYTEYLAELGREGTR